MRVRAKLEGRPVVVTFNPKSRQLAATTPSGFRYHLQERLAPGTRGLRLEGNALVWRDIRFELSDDESTLATAREMVVAAVGSGPSAAAASPSEPPRQATGEFACAGSNGRICLVGSMVEITRGSLAADLVLGQLRGTKTIPIRMIQAVQLKRATAAVAGAIEFVVAGDRSNTGQLAMVTGNGLVDALAGRRLARAGHENTVTFNRTQEPPFLVLHERILALMAGLDVPAPVSTETSAPDGNLVQGLERLRVLHESGALDDDEYQVAKARLLER